ncbi:MAG: helix-hairpin-helix domain-containing protein, partial [Desulfurobacteriaceae bacterium]
FEKAATLRDQFFAIKNLYEKGFLFFEEYKDCDVFYLEEKWGIFFGLKITVRNGIVFGKEKFQFDPIEPWEDNLLKELTTFEKELTEDVVGTIWIKASFENEEPPKEIFANFNYLADNLTVKPIPKEILEFIEKNRTFERINLNLKALIEEYEKVFMDDFPQRVEVFDISTLQGEGTVGSCIVWERGSFLKNEYRRYRVKSVSGINDYASMEEVLTRRFKKIKKGEVKPPNLVLVDGGLGQLNIAKKVRDSFSLTFRVFSIAKKEEIVYTDEGEVIETKKYPHLFRFFTFLRDEAHRFALSFNRKVRSQKMLKSIFDDIKGLGPKRKEILEKFYKDLRELALATPDELAKLGIPKKVAVEVIERIRKLF